MDNWLLMAFIAPISWALVNLIDFWMSKEVFKEELEAAAVIGGFSSIIWLAVPFLGWPSIALEFALLSALGGLFFVAFTYFYFRAIFATDDVTLISILLNLVGVLVPVLAFIFLGESLSQQAYLGIGIVVIASMLANAAGGKIDFVEAKKFLVPTLMAVLCFSLSMVAEQHVYANAGFYDGLLCFAVGATFGGLLCYIAISVRNKECYKIPAGAGIACVITELTNIAGMIGSHYAIKISPSVSFVAAIESTVPIFVLLGATVMYLYYRYVKVNLFFQAVLRKQFRGLVGKLNAIALICYGIYIIA